MSERLTFWERLGNRNTFPRIPFVRGNDGATSRERKRMAEEYRRIVSRPLPPEVRARYLAHPPTAFYCQDHKRTEPIGSPCRGGAS